MDKNGDFVALISLMEVALGNPPHEYPRGCVHLFQGCLRRIPGDWTERDALKLPVRRLFHKFMNFIAAFATNSRAADDNVTRMTATLMKMKECTCAHAAQCAEIQNSLDIHEQVQDRDYLSVFNTIILHMVETLDHHFYKFNRMCLPGASIVMSPFMSQSRRNQARWPAQASELLPTPRREVFELLLRWPRPSQLLYMMIPRFLQAFRAELVPALVSSSAIQHWISWTMDVEGKQLEIPPDPSPNFQEYRDYCEMLIELIEVSMAIADVLFDDELRAWWTCGGTVHEGQVLGAWLLLYDMPHYYRKTILYDENVEDDPIAGFEQSIYDMSGRFLHAIGLLELPRLLVSERRASSQYTAEEVIVREILEEAAEQWVDDMSNPHLRLLRVGYGPQWLGRCHGPTCMRTRASEEGRKFALCQGCKRAAYCSRRCQKIAWSHSTAPHREVCRISKEVTVLQRDAKHGENDQIRVDSMLMDHFTSEQAESACVNIQSLVDCKTSLICMSKDYDRIAISS
jgi:hypothetical protein